MFVVTFQKLNTFVVVLFERLNAFVVVVYEGLSSFVVLVMVVVVFEELNVIAKIWVFDSMKESLKMEMIVHAFDPLKLPRAMAQLLFAVVVVVVVVQWNIESLEHMIIAVMLWLLHMSELMTLLMVLYMGQLVELLLILHMDELMMASQNVLILASGDQFDQMKELLDTMLFHLLGGTLKKVKVEIMVRHSNSSSF